MVKRKKKKTVAVMEENIQLMPIQMVMFSDENLKKDKEFVKIEFKYLKGVAGEEAGNS